MKVSSSAMARSDSEDAYEVTEGGANALAKLQNHDVDDTVLDKPNDTTIHSGHFMVSHVHDEPLTLAEESDRAAEESIGYDIEGGPPDGQLGQAMISGDISVSGGGANSRNGSGSTLAIDGSLNKLFECMTLAHCNKLTSPKWRNFKGINVRLKDKIRLNNIIWREWHMQYIQGASPIVCHFETPVADKNAGTLALPPNYYELLQRVGQSNSAKTGNPNVIAVPMFSANDLSVLDESVFSDLLKSCDTLFTSYNTANAYNPNSTQTQSAIEEFMDTLEPLPPPLAIDFRGFGRLSSNASICSSAIQTGQMRILSNQITNSGLNQSTQQSLLDVASLPPLSFESEADVLALLQNQIMSEPSYDCLMTDATSIIESSGYSSSGAAVASGFTVSVSDGNLVSMTATDGLDIRFLTSSGNNADESNNVQDYVSSGDGGTSRLCNMFFLPDTTTTIPVQSSLPMFTAVDERVVVSEASGVHTGRLVTASQQQPLQDFFLRGRLTAAGNESKKAELRPTSVGLPRVKSKQMLSEAGRASRSLGSIQTEQDKMDLGTRSSTGALLAPSSSKSGFRIPRNTGARPKHSTTTLPTLQPRPHKHDVSSVKQGTTMLLPKPAPHQQNSAHEWQLQTTNKTEMIGLQFLNQFLRKPDANGNEDNAVERNETSSKQRRTRHKSDQSSAPQGTTVRPIAVFQPINPLLTSMKRISSKANSTVSFSLENNITIAPAAAAVVDSSAIQNLIISASGQTFVMTTADPLTTVSNESLNDSIRSNSFGENLNSSLASGHSCDYSDLLLFNPPSNRSRHTSNDSTGSYFDEFGGKTPPRRSDVAKQKTSKEHRRVSHITAEQNRRSSIKCGFDTLIQLIPDLKDNASSRVSKAAALHKASDLCKKLKHERAQKHDEAEMLRNEIKSLEAEISACQLQLPATGAPPMMQPSEPLDDKFDEYVCRRTLENWKFFIFSLITRPLLKSFDENVTGRTCNELCESVLSWLQNHCSLASLRPVVTTSMLHLSRKTSILSDPSLLPDEAKNVVLRQNNLLR